MTYYSAYDVMPMDLDDPVAQQAVSDEISAFRLLQAGEGAGDAYDPSDMLVPMDIDATHPEHPLAIFVVDTNFLISHLQFFIQVLKVLPAPQMIVLVPYVVLKELDALKDYHKRSSRRDASAVRYRMNPGSDTPALANEDSLSNAARDAISFLYDAFHKRLPTLRGQQINDYLPETPVADLSNDDKILECCRFARAKYGAQVALLSNDKNLGVKAMVNHIFHVRHYKCTPQQFVDDARANMHLENHVSLPTLRESDAIAAKSALLPVHQQRVLATEAQSFELNPILNDPPPRKRSLPRRGSAGGKSKVVNGATRTAANSASDHTAYLRANQDMPIDVGMDVMEIDLLPPPHASAPPRHPVQAKTGPKLHNLPIQPPAPCSDPIEHVAVHLHYWVLKTLSAALPSFFKKNSLDPNMLPHQPPWELTDIFLLMQVYWRSIFADMLGRDTRDSLGTLIQTSRDLERGFRYGRTFVTKGDLMKFCKDIRGIETVCLRAGKEEEAVQLCKIIRDSEQRLSA
ncbi:hypothetical protein HDU85_003315 [Gaertneriomyces sp. JEL0708]|nr:hypothetical protein HDU85_003315 [Gaertneriomyces sp. JEL0708]